MSVFTASHHYESLLVRHPANPILTAADWPYPAQQELIGGRLPVVFQEEAAIRLIEPNLDKVWHPNAGEPVFGYIEKK